MIQEKLVLHENAIRWIFQYLADSEVATKEAFGLK
jgi:hypothetical protein